MLLLTNKDIVDYGPILRLKRGTLCISFAESHDAEEGSRVAVLPLEFNYENEDIDPIFFAMENFDIVADFTSEKWITKKVENNTHTEISSFLEWFNGGFWYRAHDWSLNGEDYRTIRTYFEEYKSVYSAWLESIEK
ncbi:hypothetical protein IPP75_01090 [Candidatus Saccharibacteria bacterium]|nr:MAG: hypothetical protein IPP75_01090 [Candidatus Saccharibacteria bacterium]